MCLPRMYHPRWRSAPPEGTEGQSLGELEDFRHLYAHNDAGETDAECARNSVATGFRWISGISVITPALRRVFWGTFR